MIFVVPLVIVLPVIVPVFLPFTVPVVVPVISRSPSHPLLSESCNHPTVHTGVALLTVRRISQGLMIRRCGFLERPQMATDAVGRKSLTIELSHCTGSVTRITVHCGVRSDQWKTILMFVDGMNRYLPAADPVAHIALRSVLAPVDVGMAVLAIAADVGEYRVDMAILAGHPHMQAAQWITGLPVIKLRLGADRHPSRGCVALLARNFHRAMRASTRRIRDRLLPGRHTRGDLE
jgi:hypothetical protein